MREFCRASNFSNSERREEIECSSVLNFSTKESVFSEDSA
jgi:hypothetical protein